MQPKSEIEEGYDSSSASFFENTDSKPLDTLYSPTKSNQLQPHILVSTSSASSLGSLFVTFPDTNAAIFFFSHPLLKSLFLWNTRDVDKLHTGARLTRLKLSSALETSWQIDFFLSFFFFLGKLHTNNLASYPQRKHKERSNVLQGAAHAVRPDTEHQ